jgi:hypothetical protein
MSVYFCGKRAMHAWLSIIAFAFSIGAAMAEDLPAPVQKEIAEAKRGCKTVAIEKGFITRKDINGDGRPDFVLDYESFICDGKMSGASIFVRSRDGRRSLLAWPATRTPVERTRPSFAKSPNPGTARPSWKCLPRERVQRPE